MRYKTLRFLSLAIVCFQLFFPSILTGQELLIQYADYTGKHLSVSTSNSRATDFNRTGSRFYILGRDTQNIVEYHLSSTWDITTASQEDELDITSAGSVTNGIYIRKSDGEKMWILNRTEIWEYTLSTPWDVSTAQQTGHQDLSSSVTRGHDFDFKPDGSVLYVDDRDEGTIVQYKLSSSWDIETASVDYVLDIDNRQDEVRGIQFSEEGDRMFLMDTGLSEILEYHLSSSYDVSSAKYIGSFSVSSQSSDPRGLTFSRDFSGFYVTDASSNRVFQYRIDIPVLHVPGILAASNVTETGFRANWESVGNARSYQLQVSSGPDFSSSNLVADRDVNDTHYDVSDLPTNNTYYYRVRALGDVAKDSDFSESERVRVATVDEVASSVTASPAKVLSNGQQKSTITVTLRDETEEVINGMNVNLTANRGDSRITEVQSTADSDGQAIFTVTNSTPEAVTYTATVSGRTIEQTATVRFVTIDPVASMLVADPATVEADGEEYSTLTATAIDEDGDLLEGVVFTLSVSGGSSEISSSQATTNPDGEATFQVTNQVAQRVTYTASAGGRSIDQTATVNFIPRAPVSLSATNVENRRFTANWEVVDGAIKYLLDVSTDENFSNFTGDYDGFDTGNQTRIVVENVAPGTTYFYRLRAETEEGLIGANSIPIEVTTFPDSPVVAAASERSATQFQANWEPAEGAEEYLLDVSENSNFSGFVSGYESLNVESDTQYMIEGLLPGTTYFYRVRSKAKERISGHSDYTEVRTVAIDTDLSGLVSEQLRLLGNGEQENTITITVIGEEGTPLPGVPITLSTNDDNQYEGGEGKTDENGRVNFKVSSSKTGEVVYDALAGGVVPVGSITVEYLPEDGELRLGDNFPNPFNGSTRIPLNIPEPMHVELTISNVLGIAVRTLKDEQMNTGYYEIPFTGDELASGVYFYRLITDEGFKTGKMVLVK